VDKHAAQRLGSEVESICCCYDSWISHEKCSSLAEIWNVVNNNSTHLQALYYKPVCSCDDSNKSPAHYTLATCSKENYSGLHPNGQGILKDMIFIKVKLFLWLSATPWCSVNETVLGFIFTLRPLYSYRNIFRQLFVGRWSRKSKTRLETSAKKKPGAVAGNLTPI